jgi:hypothetical protein
MNRETEEWISEGIRLLTDIALRCLVYLAILFAIAVIVWTAFLDAPTCDSIGRPYRGSLNCDSLQTERRAEGNDG